MSANFNDILGKAIKKQDKIDRTMKILDSAREVTQFLEDEEARGGETFWEDKEGFGFDCDMGYFFEGLEKFIAYLEDRLLREAKE